MKETELAKMLGMTRQALTSWRKKYLDSGWDDQEREYEAEGVAAVKAAFGIEEELPAELEVVEGVVEYLPRNPRLLLVKIEGEEELARVKVRDQDLFVRGMQLQLKPLVEVQSSNTYVLAGRHPRWRGKW